MTKILIHLVAAARPNFMKIAPLFHALKKKEWAETKIVHTGQHYDLNMSDAFFIDLKLPDAHIHLGVGSGSHAEQTGRVLMAYEKVIIETRPDLVIVVGDVNSTLACTIATSKINFANNVSKLGIYPNNRPVIAHLEAGLRSFDRTMPEEINRIVTDSLADILWTPSADADDNLLREGVDRNKIIRVGNIMIDSFEMLRSKIETAMVFDQLKLRQKEYCMVTLHRPANVDDHGTLTSICESLIEISSDYPVVFPVHPRTLKNLMQLPIYRKMKTNERIRLLEPMNYISFMNLVSNCKIVITDSGGIQEETTYLGIPCLTLRPNTERPVTIMQGTNKLCSHQELASNAAEQIIKAKSVREKPEFWDGHTSERIVSHIKSALL